MQRASIEDTLRLLNIHLTKHGLLDHEREDRPSSWTVRNSPLNNRGVFATRSLRAGQVVLQDAPLISGPRWGCPLPDTCIICHSDGNKRPCSRGCGLLICSVRCEEVTAHRKECHLILNVLKRRCDVLQTVDETLMKTLCILRALLLDEDAKRLAWVLCAQKNPSDRFEVEALTGLKLAVRADDALFMRRISSVVNTNAFEVSTRKSSTFRGLYPLGALLNHSCSPNTMHVFDSQQRMVVKTTVDVEVGQELFACYTRPIWSTLSRRFHLQQTKRFWCRCARCADPTEFGSFVGGFRCESCEGFVVNEEPLSAKAKGTWKCVRCGAQMDGGKVGLLVSALGSRLGSLVDGDVAERVQFLRRAERLAAPNHSIVVEVKYSLVWVLGHEDGYEWQELPLELLSSKRTFCQELLSLLETLRLGLCKMRGLLLYELACCLREFNRREPSNNDAVKNAMITAELFQAARSILEGDCAMPKELRS